MTCGFQGRPGLNGLKGAKGDRGIMMPVSDVTTVPALPPQPPWDRALSPVPKGGRECARSGKWGLQTESLGVFFSFLHCLSKILQPLPILQLTLRRLPVPENTLVEQKLPCSDPRQRWEKAIQMWPGNLVSNPSLLTLG